MTAKTITPAPAAAPSVAETTASLLADLGGFLPAKPVAPAKPAKPLTARDYVRNVDLAIIIAAGTAVDELVPEQFRTEVRQLVANQLHHLTTPKAGWPSATLPTPDRSEWR
jgi:hypothetical protein